VYERPDHHDVATHPVDESIGTEEDLANLAAVRRGDEPPAFGEQRQRCRSLIGSLDQPNSRDGRLQLDEVGGAG
jgi:hypothetical protein